MVPARWRLTVNQQVDEDRSVEDRKAQKMTNLVDYMLELYRNPDAAQAFIDDPEAALGAAGLASVTAAQVQAVAASVSPSSLEQGDSRPGGRSAASGFRDSPPHR